MSALQREAALGVLFMLLAGCDKPPNASLSDLKFTRNPDRAGYTVAAVLHLPARKGFYSTNAHLTFGDGCQRPREHIDTTYLSPAIERVIPISYQVETMRKLARADVSISFEAESGNERVVFNTSQVVDASLHPPAMPERACGPTPAEAKAAERKLARTNPTAADGDAISHMSRNEVVATAINTAGFLCARVTDLYPNASGEIIAHCVRYRSGRGRATYRIDADGGTVAEVD